MTGTSCPADNKFRLSNKIVGKSAGTLAPVPGQFLIFYIYNSRHYWSVLKGEAGRPSWLYTFGLTGLSAQA